MPKSYNAFGLITMRIRKYLYAAIVVVCIMGVALPYFAGMFAEYYMTHITETLSKLWGVSFTVDSYDRGWFRSQATLSLIIKSPDANKPPLHFQIKDRISHGPIIIHYKEISDMHIHFATAVVRGVLSIPDEYKTEKVLINKMLAKPVSVKTFTSIHYNGSVHLVVDSPNFDLYDAGHDLQVRWRNLTASWRISPTFSNVSEKSQIAEISIVHDDVSYSVSGVSLKLDFEKTEHGLWVGNANLDLPFTIFEFSGKDRFILKELKAELSTERLGNVYSLYLRIKLAKLITNKMSFGPGAYRLALKNMDAKTLADFFKLIDEQDFFDSNNKQAPQVVYALLPKLLSRGFQFELNPFDMTGPGGTASLNAWFTVPNAHKQFLLNQGLLPLLRGANGGLTLEVPKKVALRVAAILSKYEQSNFSKTLAAVCVEIFDTSPLSAQQKTKAQQILDDWQHRGLIADKGAKYQFSLAYMNQQFYLNDKAKKFSQILRQ